MYLMGMEATNNSTSRKLPSLLPDSSGPTHVRVKLNYFNDGTVTSDSTNSAPTTGDLATHPDHSPVSASSVDVFQLSPLIRLTLLTLYIALTLPLPFLAIATSAPIPANGLWVVIVIGAIALYAALTERVIVTDDGIQVTYPRWVPSFFRKGWFLVWADIQALKPRTTGQGGLVYYFVSTSQQAYLLPMRVAGFARLVRRVQEKTGIDTTDVRPLSQPWMYLILLTFTLLLLLVDSWVIWTAWSTNSLYG
jgi:hypothetical protein